MSLKSINPYSGLQFREYEEYGTEKLEELLRGTYTAFKKWRTTDSGYRRSLIKKVASCLIQNIAEYSMTITLEMGKPISESRAEVEKCAWVCEYYAENAERFLTREFAESDAFSSYICYEPLGPVLGIMPWNFPFWQVFRFAVPTLMAGNTVLLKHASNVQSCAGQIEEIFTKSGFPPFVFTNLVIGSPLVGKVIENDIVKAISLTGSEQAGRKVAEAAGRCVKKSLLELGGSNAFVVLEDADVEKAAEIGVRARMMNAGQSCIAAKRFIIHSKIVKSFIDHFLRKMNGLKAGDPAVEGINIGPLATLEQAMLVEKQVNESVEMGATILAGGNRLSAFYSPTVIVNVIPGMPVFDEEVFGPVAPIITVNDTAEAIALAKKTKFGLGVSLFTNDLEKAGKLAGEFDDGAVFVNELVKSDPRLPFGGTNRSGYGRELSVQGIREFVNIKTIYINKI